MDLKNIENKEHLKTKVAEMLSEYNDLFIKLIDDPSEYKRGALLYYWLRDYKNYIKSEEDFSPNYYPSFKKGALVNVNLGFNIGSEMGGLHYALVIKDSNRKSPNLVIIPLTSLKPNKDISRLRPTDLYLGEELYYKIQGKFEALKVSMPTEIELLRAAIKSHPDNAEAEHIKQKLNDLEKKIILLAKTKKKLSSLKHGSICVLNQIRTISKMRLIDPKDKYDVLYGLRLSNTNLTKIENKIIELYANQELDMRK